MVAHIIGWGSEGVQGGVGVLRASQSTLRGKRTLFGRTAALSHLEARAKDNHFVMQPIDFFLVEPILFNLHPGADGPACAQFFDSIANGLSRCRKAPVVLAATLGTLRQEQFNRGARKTFS
jgi:hypothetical protein